MSFQTLTVSESSQSTYLNSKPDGNEPIISFSPAKCRFDAKLPQISNHAEVDINGFLMEQGTDESWIKNHDASQNNQLLDVIGNNVQDNPGQGSESKYQVSEWNKMESLNNIHGNILNSENFESIKLSNSETEMSRLESPAETFNNMNAVVGTDEITTAPRTTEFVTSQNPISIASNSYSSGFDMRKVPSLLPPQRLAIPQKSSNVTTTGSTSSKPQEFKPLVQWDSDESEEELSFFPAPKNRSALTDNLSIDNMSLSGEEDQDDLHLSPPSRMASRCPCDPRLLIDSKFTKSSSTSASKKFNFQKQCTLS